MQIVRFLRQDDPPKWGWIEDKHVGLLSASPFEPFNRTESQILLDKVQLLPPVEPGKIIAVGRNYIEHAQEHQVEVPDRPLIFLKPASSVAVSYTHLTLPTN